MSPFRLSWVGPALAGIVLVLAACLKAFELASAPGTGIDFIKSRWLAIAVTELEFLFGCWLIFGSYSPLTRLGGIFLFAVYLAVSLFKGLMGEPSCGCFSNLIETSPWLFAALDAGVLLALVFSPPSDSRRLPWRWATFPLLAIGATGLYFMSTYEPALIAPDGELVGEGSVVVVEPEKWLLGQRFPLLKQINVGDKLASGNWLVFFYRVNCAKCQGKLIESQNLARSTGMPFAVVEIAEKHRWGPSPEGQDAEILYGRLDGEKEWFMETPLVVRLTNGGVVSVNSSNSSAPVLSSAGRKAVAASSSEEFRQLLSGRTHPRVPGFPDYWRARRDRLLSETACGPLALISILHHSGVRLTQKERLDLLADHASPAGTSLLRLKELAETHGLYAMGAELGLADLKEIGLPAIVHLYGTSFAAFLGSTGKEGVRLLVPLEQEILLSDEDFTKALGRPGRALLLSTEPIRLRNKATGQAAAPPPNMPVLRLSPTHASIGRIHGNNWMTRLQVHNAGGTPLAIKNVQASCSCISATVENREVAPGESTVLRIEGTQETVGTINQTVSLLTNQAQHPVVTIPVQGFAEPALVLDAPARSLRVVENVEGQTCVPFILASKFNASEIRVAIPNNSGWDREPKSMQCWPGWTNPLCFDREL